MTLTPDDYEVKRKTPVRHIIANSTNKPSVDVVAAFESGFVQVTRRVEVYESDGRTLWLPEGDTEFDRLVTGTVTVDQSSDERRKADFVFDNVDQLLRANPYGGFWYDKIIKPYRGIRYIGGAAPPKVAIIEAPTPAEGRTLKQFIATLGYEEIDIITWAGSSDELAGYGLIVSYTSAVATTKADLLRTMWQSGINVLTIGTGSNETHLPHYATSAAQGVAITWGLQHTSNDSPATNRFEPGPVTPDATGAAPLTLSGGVVGLALWTIGVSTNIYTAALATSPQGGRWTDIHLPDYNDNETKRLIRAMSNYMRDVGQEVWWEIQMGEYMVDGIALSDFPDQVRVTTRDYTKKLLQSKLAVNTSFIVGTSVKDMLRSLAINSGIDPLRIRLSVGNELLTSEMSYNRGTSRHQIMKDVCTSFNYEMFFDTFGDLVIRPFIDPTTGPVSWTFKTGEDGNLIKFDKSVADTDIYNHVIVTAQPPDDSELMPFFGEAKNTDPESPTRIEKLGDRVLPIEADYLSSNEQCQALAEQRLKVTALEAYSVSTDSLYYPWLECGTIVEVLDPDALPIEPTRYLLTSLSFPLELSPMSGTSKRITFVGDPGNG